MSHRKTILFIACSVDGYIASVDEDLGFLSRVEKQGEDYGYSDFISQIDCVILGKRTYDKVMSMTSVFPHAGKETYIVTRSPKKPIGNTVFYDGNLKSLIESLRTKEGKNIFIDGGSKVIKMLLDDDLIDEMIISYIPVLLGEGIPLFAPIHKEKALESLSVKAFESGLIQVHYRIIH